MIHGIATGIGFLGAGSIMRGGGDVRGVTTAAGIWAAGALGSACGLRYYDLAVGLTVVMLLILYPLELLERWMETRTGIKE
jgi:putative Mg2+ transporter-C (MgtC) family protein